MILTSAQFLSTLSLRRATEAGALPNGYAIISIHALLAESDWALPLLRPSVLNFYPRSPCGERRKKYHRTPDCSDFYPRSPCGERRTPVRVYLPCANDFYPRSPCGERHANTSRSVIAAPFLSTLSLRRATKITNQCKIDQKNFYPRSPCGERRILAHHSRKIIKFLSTLSLRRATTPPVLFCDNCIISIHALLAESDRGPPGLLHSLGGVISIHALLAESDISCARSASKLGDFYPRSPCGERQLYINRTAKTIVFLSTLSLRRATEKVLQCVGTPAFLSTLSLRRATRANRLANAPPHISIHALLAESDALRQLQSALRRNFYPRSPCGERRVTVLGIQHRVGISIHALLAESDLAGRTHKAPMTTIFLSTLSLRRATPRCQKRDFAQSISIHALLAESDPNVG